jgi:hypothetical protein
MFQKAGEEIRIRKGGRGGVPRCVENIVWLTDDLRNNCNKKSGWESILTHMHAYTPTTHTWIDCDRPVTPVDYCRWYPKVSVE